MSQTQLHFESRTYKLPDGTEKVYVMHDDKRIELMIKELKAIVKREDERPLGHNDLPYGSEEQLLEAIDLLEKRMFYLHFLDE